MDYLVQQLFSGDNMWPEVAIHDSSSPSFFPSPSTFPSHAEITTASATPSSANFFFQCTGARFSVLERVTQALTYIRETQRYNAVLARLWMPDMPDDGEFGLTKAGETFQFDQSSGSLTRCRKPWTLSMFLLETRPMAEVKRVFGGKLPECSDWFVSLDLGLMWLPVFEKGNHSCLGVIELITTTTAHKLDTIYSALQAVNLTTTHFSSISRTKFNTASYEEAIPEILQVLRAACIIHKLPLAQTWATCAQHGKWDRHHSDENRRCCISTIDVACYVNDPRMQIFHEACSEHHLLPGQGVVGKAFATNQPSFISDIGSSVEQEYPLSHHAKIFGLKDAVAIRLRCTHTRMADFVMEFFLPTDCGVLEEQKAVLDSLWGTVRSLSRTLRMVTDKEMDDDAVQEMNEINSLGLQKNKKPMKRKRMARRSPVWNDFTEVMVGDTVKAKCNHCGLKLCCDSKTHGTSSLKSHLERCKLNPNNSIAGPL